MGFIQNLFGKKNVASNGILVTQNVTVIHSVNDDEQYDECGDVRPGANGKVTCTQEKGHQDIVNGENLHVSFDFGGQWSTPVA